MSKTSNVNGPGERSHGIVRGHTGLRAGSSGVTVADDQGNRVRRATRITFPGTLVAAGAAGEAIVNAGASQGFVPTASIVATKDAGNPTFTFMSYPENVIKVGSTYYCPYMDTAAVTAVIKLATASDRNGPWSAGSTIYSASSVPWISSPGVGTGIAAPFILEDAGTFYLFYCCTIVGGGVSASNAIGYATATAITGPYTDFGAAVLIPATAGAWDSRRVQEPAVLHHGGQWIMAYMAETSSAAFSLSEKVGIATAPTPSGPWTRHPSNPIIDFGASGEWDDALVADPDLIYADGYYWIMYAGGPGSAVAEQGLAYATDPTDTWTRYSGNPILSPGASGEWDDTTVFRGGLYFEDGTWTGVYAGFDGASTVKGGNFSLNIVSTVEDVPLRAVDIPIDDSGGYYTGTDVEAALQEIGAALAVVDSPEAGHYEVIVSGSAPPVAVTNEAADDWLYGWVSG